MHYNIRMFYKKRFVLFLMLVSFLGTMYSAAKKKSPFSIPTKVQDKIEKTEETPKCWYICDLKNKTKAGNVICGPVESRELIILIWISNSIKPDSKYCIAKNKTYITKNPEKFFADDFTRVKKDISEFGVADTYEKYFFSNYLTAGGTLTITSDEAFTVNPENEKQTEEQPQEQPQNKEPEPEEPPVSEPEVAQAPVAEPEIAEPEISEPEITEPEITEPEIAEAEIPEPAKPKETVVTESVPAQVTASAPAPVATPAPAPVTTPTPAPTTTVKITQEAAPKTSKTNNFTEPHITEEGEYVYYENKTTTSGTYDSVDIDIEDLKNELKTQLKDELITELRSELQPQPPVASVQTPKQETKLPESVIPAPVVPETTLPPVQDPEPQKLVLPEPQEESIPAPEAQQEIPEPQALSKEPEIQEVPEKAPEDQNSFELPINPDKSTAVARYQRENLLDYAPKKTPALPVDEDIETTQRIIEPNLSDSKGVTLLMNAAKAGNAWEVRNLISSGADINRQDKDGWTALMYAVRYQENDSIVESLINEGANIKLKNKYNVSALSLAATYNGNPNILKQLLSFYSPSDKEIMQAFIMMLSDNLSSEYSKAAKAQAFIEKSVPLNSFYNGKTPLMYAAQYSSSTEVIKKLLEYGASASIRAADGKTAFDYAKQNSSLPHDETYWALNKK